MEQNLQFVIQHIEDKKVPVIAAYDVRELSTFADVFVLAIAKNDPQINAIMNSFREAVKNKENNVLTIEGEPKDGWVAIQYNEICAQDRKSVV